MLTVDLPSSSPRWWLFAWDFPSVRKDLLSAEDFWTCLACAGSRSLLLAWPSLPLPKLSSVGSADLVAGSDPGQVSQGEENPCSTVVGCPLSIAAQGF